MTRIIFLMCGIDCTFLTSHLFVCHMKDLFYTQDSLCLIGPIYVSLSSPVTSIHLWISRSQTLKVISLRCCDPCQTLPISICHLVIPPLFYLKQCTPILNFCLRSQTWPLFWMSLLPGFLMPTSFCWLTPCIHMQGLSLVRLWNTLLLWMR